MNLKLPDITGLHKSLANCHPKISRGRVWCHACGRSLKIDPRECFSSGWPTCCGSTMSLDSPEEHAALGIAKFGSTSTCSMRGDDRATECKQR
jgi:hypothetical protein